MVPLELTQIQGNILRGYRSSEARFTFLAVPDPESGRSFLAELVPLLQDAARPPAALATNVAITFEGLRALGVQEMILQELPDAFREPIRQRAPRILDDTGSSAPETWDDGIGTDRTHILVAVYGKDPAPQDMTTWHRDVVRRAESHGLEVVHTQPAELLINSREHFGWADGLAQPAVEGAPARSQPGDGTPGDEGAWLALQPGEFILGYPDEDGPPKVGPATPLLRNGTYMVYRKLHQDVVCFRRHLYDEAQTYGATLPDDPPLDPDELYELMAAKVVGRWRDGEPVELTQRRAPERSAHLGDDALPHPSNNFRYADDPHGERCPVGAHIRRTNPRDALQGSGRTGIMSRRHRIIRRGMPYGPWLDFTPEERDDGIDRGLIFICFNADIERQFEVIQRQWCNDGNAFGLGHEQDYLLNRSPAGPDDGRRPSSRTTIGGSPPFFGQAVTDFVVTRGCQYLLVPGLDALRRLVDGELDEGPRTAAAGR
jgi:Dyp-type peroxidase family